MSDTHTDLLQIPPASPFAGFWRRFLAFLIDYNIVIIGLFPVFLISGFLVPNAVEVATPFDLFSTERTLAETSENTGQSNGSRSSSIRFFERTYLGKWTYLYRESTEMDGQQTHQDVTLVDPKTRKPIDLISADDFVWWVLLIYWSLMETGRHQASLGKQALRIIVVSKQGQRLGIAQAFGRNVGKLLSVMTLFIGFMMAGWTQRKQGLHDMLSSCLVIKRLSDADIQSSC